MKRDLLFVVRTVLFAFLAFTAIAVAGRLFPAVPSTSARAALNTDSQRYHNVIVVAKSGGDFDSVQKALNSITDNSPTNRYLVWVAPGTYTETVTMKQYVDIQGAGELLTRITYTGSKAFSGTIMGANNAELRFLTAENTGGNTYAVGISNSDASPSLLHVTASASRGAYGNFGVYNLRSSAKMTDMTASASGSSDNNTGVENDASSPTMINMTISASGGSRNSALYDFESAPVMTNVTASASGGSVNNGMYNDRSSLTIRNSNISSGGGQYNYGIYNFAPRSSYIVLVDNSTITGSTNTIYQSYFYTTRVGASKLDGGPVGGTGGGTMTCAGVYDEHYTFFPNTCP